MSATDTPTTTNTRTETEPFGTEEELISGVYALSMAPWPQGARRTLKRAENVTVHRARQLREALEGQDVGARLRAQAAFEEGIAAYRRAMLEMVGLQ